eukprot:TRINITY_DN3568_c0_g1_i2.p1 TRINITY_DN3568_c0_g1~~TRINITY_DN3568_c0_g1_i2.p1  ORF type:complete len:329 (+),score=45.00 TRINITY_DN3568_c0_g1_i2:100-987(+)
MDLCDENELTFEKSIVVIKQQLMAGAPIGVSTLAPAAIGIGGAMKHMARLKDLNGATTEIIDKLITNRDNLEFCQEQCRSYLSRWNQTAIDLEWKNELEFDDLMHKLTNNQNDIELQIEKIQTNLDFLGIFLIVANTGMLIHNIANYFNVTNDMRKYADQLTTLQRRALRYAEWFEGCEKTKEQLTAYRIKISEMTTELAIIEVKVETERKSQLSKGLLHGTVGVISMALSLIIPFSTPIALGVAGSGFLNGISCGLNVKLVGDFNDLLSIINQVRSVLSEANKVTSMGGVIPDF